uniref:Uncharacterized protein n=1 Tax=Phakopsora pachyrhizi TaxID=170000 RepID=A0A0S1MIS2_PHAPC
MQPPLRLFLGVLWEAFLVSEGKVENWIQRSVSANKVLGPVVWGGEQNAVT